MLLKFLQGAFMVFVVLCAPAILAAPFLIERSEGYRWWLFGCLGLAAMTGAMAAAICF